MSLATRCPACATVFRLVRDQLKVSEGWVRCGRCSEVFNASQRLFELEADAAGAAPAQPTPPAPPRTRTARTGTFSPAAVRVSSALAPPSEPAVLWAPGDDGVEAAAAAPAAASPTSAADVAGEAAATSHSEIEAQAEAAADPQPTAATPEFIRRADRAALWRQPGRRRGLAVLSLSLAALLLAQMAMHYRDGLAAASPLARPWLQAACRLLGCSIEAPRRIDSLGVDSSGLVRVDGSALYRLSLVVHNRSPSAVRMPAIDLTLTDSQGQIMARRVLSAGELGNPAASLPARGEAALQATLELGERRVAGYTVELFYP